MARILSSCSRLATCLAALSLSSLATAQDTAAEAPSPAQILTKAVKTMRGFKALSFRTTEAQNSAMGRNIARQTGGMIGVDQEVDVRGSWSQGTLIASVNQGDDELIFHASRQVARNDEVSWKLRHNRLVTGGKIPFVMNPSRLFECLGALPKTAFKVTTSEATTYRNKTVQAIGITLTGSQAQEFAMAGALPPVSSGMGGMMLTMGGGMGAAASMPELTVDLAFYVEATTGHIHKIKSRTYQEASGPGNVQVQLGGAGGFGGDDDEEDDDDEAPEKDKDGNRIYRRGLPNRRLGDSLSRLTFDIVLSKLGATTTPEIDADARRLLRMDQ